MAQTSYSLLKDTGSKSDAKVVDGYAVPVASAEPSAPMIREIDVKAEEPWAAILSPHEGLLVREKLFLSQILCPACERQLRFNIGPWSRDMPARLDSDIFDQLVHQHTFEMREESSCCCRFCFHQFRESKIGMFAPNQDTRAGGGFQGYDPLLTVERPFVCTCCIGPVMCYPPEATVTAPRGGAAARIGHTMLNWQWYNCCWPCWLVFDVTTAFDAEGNPTGAAPQYEIAVPTCCGDGCRNCCAPTCFNPVFEMPVRDRATGATVGMLENQWPGWNCRGLCLGNSMADNYAVKFPPGASPEDKAALFSSLFLLNFLFFEKRGNQK